MKLTLESFSAGSLGLPLPIATKGQLFGVFNKGRLVRYWDKFEEAKKGFDKLVGLQVELLGSFPKGD